MNEPIADVLDLLLAVAAVNPARIAVRAGATRVTYGQIVDLAYRYAARFMLRQSPRILIALPRGADAYAAMIGAGLAGGFYTPVNDASPPEKLCRIVANLNPDFILAPDTIGRMIAGAASSAICLDPADLPRGDMSSDHVARHATAYVMFTSGSTGDPKGVVISRNALNHYIAWAMGSGSIVSNDVVSQFNNLAFDVSVLDIYGALCVGATLVPISSREDRMMPARVIAREGITVWNSVPSAIDLMRGVKQFNRSNLDTVRIFTLIGEPLLRPQVEAILSACPDAVVQNAYGPTETTVTVTQMRMTSQDHEHAMQGGAVSIGPAIPGMALHLVGGTHADEGEIVIVGPQLAQGYLNDPHRTARTFRAVAVDGIAERGYYTGDWAERHGDLLFFRTRIDNQVKIRGYRIELGEVASAIRAIGWPGVCVFKLNSRLVALVERGDVALFDEDTVRASLARLLEPYAIPRRILSVETLPRNENDKLDYKQCAVLMERLLAS